MVIVKCRKLAEYIFTVTEKSPKKFRHTIVSRLQDGVLMALEHLIRANDIYVQDKTQTGLCQKRSWYQQEAMTDMKVLGYMAMIAREQGCILPRQQEQIALQLGECRKMLWAWMLSDKKRLWG